MELEDKLTLPHQLTYQFFKKIHEAHLGIRSVANKELIRAGYDLEGFNYPDQDAIQQFRVRAERSESSEQTPIPLDSPDYQIALNWYQSLVNTCKAIIKFENAEDRELSLFKREFLSGVASDYPECLPKIQAIGKDAEPVHSFNMMGSHGDDPHLEAKAKELAASIINEVHRRNMKMELEHPEQVMAEDDYLDALLADAPSVRSARTTPPPRTRSPDPSIIDPAQSSGTQGMQDYRHYVSRERHSSHPSTGHETPSLPTTPISSAPNISPPTSGTHGEEHPTSESGNQAHFSPKK